MTLASGTKMRCDTAGCTQPATVEKDAWAFCAAHAGAPLPRPSAAPVRPVPAPAASSPASTPSAPMVQVVGGGTIGLLLEQASGHSSKRVRNLADKVEKQLDDLRALVASLAEDEKRKQAEHAKKEKARQDIVRLEQQLAAAKAVLRGKAKEKAAAGAAKPATDGVTTTSPHPCVDCGAAITRPAGIVGRFPTRCATCKAAS